jgi:uncharacterized membrane protein
MGRIQGIWEELRSSLWFVPALMVAGAVLLAVAFIELDSRINYETLVEWPVLFGSSAEGARNILSTIAGSMITVAGVTFSITIVALSLASNQYTPRILRNFMRDRANQAVLGVFVSVFIYCLIVLRSIRGGEEAFIPSLSVVFAVVLALLGIAFLIYFIHHIAASIQASTIISAVAKETIDAIRVLFPEDMGEGEEDEPAPLPEDCSWEASPAFKTGYIQGVDAEAMIAFAEKHGLVLRMERRIGDFVIEGTPLVSISPPGRLGKDAAGALKDFYAVNTYRTVAQDVAFGVRQLVDIALKALSPGVNDTTTALVCVDHLGAILYALTDRKIPPRLRYTEGALRVIARGPTFEGLVEDSFSEIRLLAKGSAVVFVRILSAIQTVATHTGNESRQRVLWRQIMSVSDLVGQNVGDEYGRAAIHEAASKAARALGQPAAIMFPPSEGITSDE